MNDDAPNEFTRLTPRPAAPELRARVLAAVDRQLSEQPACADTSPKRQRGSEPMRSLRKPSLTLRASESADAMPGGVQGVAIASAAGATAGLSSSADLVLSQHRRSARWQQWASWSVAAGLVLGIGLLGASWHTEQRLEAMYGPPPLPADVADIVREVESVAGAEGGRWLAERLTAGRTTRSWDRRNKHGQPSAWPLTEPFTYQVSSLP